MLETGIIQTQQVPGLRDTRRPGNQTLLLNLRASIAPSASKWRVYKYQANTTVYLNTHTIILLSTFTLSTLALDGVHILHVSELYSLWNEYLVAQLNFIYFCYYIQLLVVFTLPAKVHIILFAYNDHMTISKCM